MLKLSSNFKVVDLFEYKPSEDCKKTDWQVSEGRVFIREKSKKGYSRIFSKDHIGSKGSWDACNDTRIHYEGYCTDSWKASGGKVFTFDSTLTLDTGDSICGRLLCDGKVIHDGDVADNGTDWRVDNGIVYRRNGYLAIVRGNKIFSTFRHLGRIDDWKVSNGKVFVLSYYEDRRDFSSNRNRFMIVCSDGINSHDRIVYDKPHTGEYSQYFGYCRVNWLVSQGSAYLLTGNSKIGYVICKDGKTICEKETFDSWEVSGGQLFLFHDYFDDEPHCRSVESNGVRIASWNVDDMSLYFWEGTGYIRHNDKKNNVYLFQKLVSTKV